MKTWTVDYTEDAKKDIKDLDKSQTSQVIKAIDRVSQNPLPNTEGGYGNPLGNKGSTNLTGLLKIKLVKLGIRAVYKLVRTDEVMKIIVVAARADDEVSEIAARRLND
ncbi:MAG: type II toxin-antitoxin system RelE/ParE family toxin [Oscillospiraceae bacterium]|nr:type II toxin-antitoxin system RelE/ParE family toxin [Oscillospiraceae bacterium]